MPTSIGFQNQTDGQVLNRTYLNNNFEDINTYVAGGIPFVDLEHEYHSFAVTLFTGDLDAGENAIHQVELPGQTSMGTTAVIVEAQHTRAGPADDGGAVTWEYFDSYADAYNGSDVKHTVTIADDADGGYFINVTDIASAIDTAITANSAFFVRVSAATHNAASVCLTLWFKLKHSTATLES